MNKLVAIFLILLCFPSQSASINQLKNAFYQTKENHRTYPPTAIDLWQKHQHEVDRLPQKLQYNWRLYAAKAYMINKQLKPASVELNELTGMTISLSGEEQAILANMAGILFSRTSQHQLAANAYQCALKMDINRPLKRSAYLSNLALAQDRAGQTKMAINHYLQAIEISASHNDDIKLARYTANLGYALLLSQQPEKALRYLKRAVFLKQQHDNDISKFKTGIYLLHALTELKNWSLYDRYFASVSKMAKPYQDTLAMSYFNWIQVYSRFRRHNIKPDADEKSHMVAAITDVRELPGLIRSFTVIAKVLDIKAPLRAPIKRLKASIDDDNIVAFVKSCKENQHGVK